MSDPLDNIFWHALTGAQARFACGTATALRYAPGFSPIIAFADPINPDFAGLAPYCTSDEPLYCADWSGAAPEGWRIEAETTMYRMVWSGSLAETDAEPELLPLDLRHAAQAFELATLTRSGPFGVRTIELGEYLGVFEGPQLVAMAGERAQAGRLREISGVCTHPAHQERGIARRLMVRLIRRQLQRGELPFLHVMRDNSRAHDFYLRMGFHDHLETAVRVIARC